MITALSKDGSTKRQVVYNEFIMMLDKYDSLTFHVDDEKFGINMTFNFKFSDSGDKFTADGKVLDDGKVVNLTLNNWYSTKAENTTPIKLKLKNGKSIWLKYSTGALEKNDFRMFHITIWGELIHE